MFLRFKNLIYKVFFYFRDIFNVIFELMHVFEKGSVFLNFQTASWKMLDSLFAVF